LVDFYDFCTIGNRSKHSTKKIQNHFTLTCVSTLPVKTKNNKNGRPLPAVFFVIFTENHPTFVYKNYFQFVSSLRAENILHSTFFIEILFKRDIHVFNLNNSMKQIFHSSVVICTELIKQETHHEMRILERDVTYIVLSVYLLTLIHR